MYLFFTSSQRGYYNARSILVDLEHGEIDSVLGGPYGKLFKFGNIVTGNSNASDNWAKGYYTEGGQVIEYVLDAIRR